MALIKKWFELPITEPGRLYTRSYELDKNITIVKGILLVSSNDELMYQRGSQKIEINGQELFPDGYHSRLLMSGINVSPNARYYEAGELPAGNGIVKITYVDSTIDGSVFMPYSVFVYLNCRQDG